MDAWYTPNEHRPRTAPGQFVDLWSQFQGIELQSQEDEVTWGLETSGQYSAKSAYNIQSTEAFSELDWSSIWKFKAKPKCRFFIWLLLQRKLPTADRIIK